MSSILKGITINESLQDDFIELMKSKGYNVKPRGSIEQQKAERDAMLAQRAKDQANAPAPAAPSPEEIANAKEKLAQLERVFDKNYQYSDDHSVWSKNHDIAQQIGSLKKLIARGEQGVAEGSTMSWIVYRQDTTLYPNGERDHETEVVKTFNNDQEAEDYAKKLNAANRDYDVYYFVRGKQQGVAEGSLNELAPSTGGNGDDGMGWLHALARAWYTQDLSLLADIARKGGSPMKKIIDAQVAVEKILGRGVHCPDGKVRKYYIDYNAEFDGVDLVSHEYYEHSDYGPNDEIVDGRTGKPWSAYDHIEFSDDQLNEGVAEGSLNESDKFTSWYDWKDQAKSSG